MGAGVCKGSACGIVGQLRFDAFGGCDRCSLGYLCRRGWLRSSTVCQFSSLVASVDGTLVVALPFVVVHQVWHHDGM